MDEPRAKRLATGSTNANGGSDGKAKGNFLVFPRNDRNPLAQPMDKQDPFKTNVILMKVFRNMSQKDLLNCSLVNKAWGLNARTVLRTERKSLATLRGVCPCREYRELSKLLRTSASIPFNGIVIRTQPKRVQSKYSKEDPESIEQVIPEIFDRNSTWNNSKNLEKSPAEEAEGTSGKRRVGHKCLEWPINFESSAFFQKVDLLYLEIDWQRVTNCQIENLIKVCLTKKVDKLLELKVSRFPPTVTSLYTFLEFHPEDCKGWLRNVKLLDLPPDTNFRALGGEIRRELLEASPNLRGLIGLNRLPDLGFYLERYLTPAIQEFDFYYVFRKGQLVVDYKNYSLLNLVRTKPRFQKFLVTVDFNDTSFDEKKIHFLLSFLGLVLESSKFSLKEFSVNQYQLLLLICLHIIQPLGRVQKFSLGMSIFPDFQTDLILLKRIPWAHFFPNLKTVKIFLTDLQDDILPCAHAPLETLGEIQTCNTVTQLVLRQFQDSSEIVTFPENVLTFLRELFPNVKELTLERVDAAEDFLKAVWVIWPDLEQLALEEVEISTMQNLDAVFCGVSPEDTKLLQGKSARELKGVNFVPERPCIITMPNLRKFRVEMKPHEVCGGKVEASNLFFASRVTGLLAFLRSRNLRVEIVKRECGANCGYSLKHLESFVRFVNE